MMRTLIPLLFCTLVVPAQQATFTSTTQLVVETVTVKDKNGNTIPGLTAKDFLLTEDGKPQTIAFVEYQTLPEGPPAPITFTTSVPAVPRLTRTQISAEKPGDIRYRDRRLLALYFDFSAMPPPDQARALQAAQRFI